MAAHSWQAPAAADAASDGFDADWDADGTSETSSSRGTVDTIFDEARHEKPVHIKNGTVGVEARPSRARSSRSGPRQPHAPYGDRLDVGTFSVYQGNWGGRSKHADIRQHIYKDIVMKNPGHIITMSL